ncbi:MAG TPA: DUF177 domain-containing protein [Blastocatellia bacterium]|jgi:uncharacterized protein
MKISISKISEDEGLNIHHLYPDGEPDLSGGDARLVGRPELDLQATRAGDEVRVVGHLKATVEIACDRCLKPLTMPVDQSFDLLYVPPAKTSEEKELGDDDLSIAFYQDEAIDVDDLVREQVELALPMARLCGEECRGLCPECGANLNEGDCLCSDERVDPRWGALKELKSNTN